MKGLSQNAVVTVVETLDEDSRDEGCFVKNKTFFIEESSSAQTHFAVLSAAGNFPPADS